MNLDKSVQQLENQGKAILALGKDLSTEQARWKPGPEDWSILEVLNHLVDEEQLDFRRHLDHILYTPQESWPKIAPQDWVIAKKYNLLGLDQTLDNFKSEREKSIDWLNSLANPDWNMSIKLSWGKLSSGDILASWLAHDLLHLRQLVDLRFQLTKSGSAPFNIDYAGKW